MGSPPARSSAFAAPPNRRSALVVSPRLAASRSAEVQAAVSVEVGARLSRAFRALGMAEEVGLPPDGPVETTFTVGHTPARAASGTGAAVVSQAATINWLG
jgi:hypothetical protein